MRKRSRIAIHPGEFLAEILTELEISQAEFARAIGVSPMRVSYVVRGTRPVTAELALLFGRALGQSAEYWLNLQAAYDLATARNTVRLKRVHTTVLKVPDAVGVRLEPIPARPARSGRKRQPPPASRTSAHAGSPGTRR
jgi:addiction module HigA family antidote